MRALSVVSAPETQNLRLDAYLPFRLATATAAVSRLLRRACEKQGVSIAQWRALCVLSEETPITAGRIAARGAFEPEAAVQALADLVSMSLVEGVGGAFQLTPAGVEACAEIAPLALACEAALLAGLAPREVRDLMRLLARVDAAARRLNGES